MTDVEKIKFLREIPVGVLEHWARCFRDGTVQDEYGEEISNLLLEHVKEKNHMTYIGAVKKDGDSWLMGYGRNMLDVRDGLKDRSDKDQFETLRVWKVVEISHPFAITYHRVSLKKLKDLLERKGAREVIV